MEAIKIKLAAKLKDLGERDRLILSLYYYENLTIVEIAKVLKLTEKTALKGLDLALDNLREKL